MSIAARIRFAAEADSRCWRSSSSSACLSSSWVLACCSLAISSSCFAQDSFCRNCSRCAWIQFRSAISSAVAVSSVAPRAFSSSSAKVPVPSWCVASLPLLAKTSSSAATKRWFSTSSPVSAALSAMACSCSKSFSFSLSFSKIASDACFIRMAAASSASFFFARLAAACTSLCSALNLACAVCNRSSSADLCGSSSSGAAVVVSHLKVIWLITMMPCPVGPSSAMSSMSELW
mmetsp:Transcript_75928/g.212873  ORF Transcript_75928/g.212873 Transcript_75928/m.212873 type:complete len:233 (+) Transcript_75928:813-1511(+)